MGISKMFALLTMTMLAGEAGYIDYGAGDFTASPRATTTTAPSGCRPRALSTTATVAAPTRTATTASSKQRTFCGDAPIATVAVISDLCYRLGGRDLCGFPSIHRPQSQKK